MIFYALIKFVAYCCWCFVGLRIFAPERATLAGSVKYGSIRWLVGLGFGMAAAVALGSVSSESVAALYFGVYVPLRIVEWAIVLLLMRGASSQDASLLRNPRAWFWVAGGIVVSFASDAASPEGMAGRFCVGRCLC